MRRAILLMLPLLFPALVGCGADQQARVSGTVTLNNEPLKKGLISFAPKDPGGSTAGGDIIDGKYEAVALKPGKYVVHIAGVPEGPVIMPGSPEAARTPTKKQIQAMIDPLPPDATGNDQTIDLPAGDHVRPIALESKSAGR